MRLNESDEFISKNRNNTKWKAQLKMKNDKNTKWEG